MKPILPIALSLALAACATNPAERAGDHQWTKRDLIGKTLILRDSQNREIQRLNFWTAREVVCDLTAYDGKYLSATNPILGWKLQRNHVTIHSEGETALAFTITQLTPAHLVAIDENGHPMRYELKP